MPLDRQVLALIRRKHVAGLMAVATELTGRAKVIATRHTDNGTRRNSITQAPSDDGSSVLWGIPVNSAPHAVYLELGFRPHWVHARNVGVWMQRHGVGITRNGKTVTGKIVRRQGRQAVNLRARGTAVALGMYVGGPNSRLQTAPGGTQGTPTGRKRRLRSHWHTKGGTSKYLSQARVGHPILQPAAEDIRDISPDVFRRGWQNGR